MKRLLLITENLGPGGAERQLTALAVLLVRRGYAVRLITWYENQFFEPVLREGGVDYALLPGLMDKCRRIPGLLREIRRYRPDCVVSFLPPVNESLCLARLLQPFRLIVSERSFTRHFGLRERLRFGLYRMADAVVCNSRAETENLVAHLPGLREKLHTIPNFVDSRAFSPALKTGAPAAVPAGSPVPSGGARTEEQTPKAPLMLFAGRLIPEKNLCHLVRAAGTLHREGLSLRLRLIGPGYDAAYVRLLRDTVREEGLEDLTEILPPTRNLVEDYRRADVFCLPSRVEGCPNTLCEALSCGLPAVCNDISALTDIVSDGVEGFIVDASDVQALAGGLKKMLSLSPARRAEMGAAGRRKMCEQYGAEAYADAYIRLLENA